MTRCDGMNEVASGSIFWFERFLFLVSVYGTVIPKSPNSQFEKGL